MVAAFAVALAIAAGACSLILDTSPNQCDSGADCVTRFGSSASMQCINQVCVSVEAAADVANDAPVDAGPWGCLGNVVFPQPDASTVSVTVPLVDLITMKPVTAVNALLCAKTDFTCGTPLASTQPTMNGLLVFNNLTPPFNGYVLITPVLPDGGFPDGGDGGSVLDLYVPSLVYFNPPLVHDTLYTTTILVTGYALGTVAMGAQTPLDLDAGAVFMETVDCNGHPAPGVSVIVDSTGPLTKGFYFQGGLPTTTASSTDVTGYAGFVNVPLGPRTVTGTLQGTGQRIGTATVLAAKSVISYTTLAPSP
jgi:hypothetical protein